MGKKSFIAGFLAEEFLEDLLGTGTTRYVVQEPAPVTRTIVVPVPTTTNTTTTVPTRGQYSTPTQPANYGCHSHSNGNGRMPFSTASASTTTKTVVSHDTAVALFERIERAIKTSPYSGDYARRMGRELAYVITEGRSSGWKDDFYKTLNNVRELRTVCAKFNIPVVLHGSDRQYEKLFEQLDAVLSSNDVVIA